MASRTLELILKVSNQASADLKALRNELKDVGDFKIPSDQGLLGKQASQASQQIGDIRKGLDGLADGAGKAKGGFQSFFGPSLTQLGQIGSAVTGLASGIGLVTGAFGAAMAAGTAFFNETIGRAEKFNAQILQSQTGLAAASRIFQGGVEVTDPTAKINATKDRLKAALKEVEQDTKQLVGVTSEQVNQFFQTALTNSSELINQSKQFKDPIESATKLTKGLAAAFKVVGLDEFQIPSEIRSLLTGEELDNSTLAKTLQISRDQIIAWKQQGVLVDELEKRLKTFVAGNAIAAQSIDGVSSNIAEFFQQVARDIGQGFIAPLVDGLLQVEKYLTSIQAPVTQFAQESLEIFADIAGEIINSFAPAFKGVEQLIATFGRGLKAEFQIAAEAIKVVASILGGLTTAFFKLYEAGAPVREVVVQAFEILANVVSKGWDNIREVIKGIPEFFDGIWKQVQQGGQILNEVFKFFTGFDLSKLAEAFQVVIKNLEPVLSKLQGVGDAINAALASTFDQDVTERVKSARAAVEGYKQQIAETAATIKELQDKQKNGGTLTDEEQNRLKDAIFTAGQLKRNLNETVTGLGELKPIAPNTKKDLDEVTKLYQEQDKALAEGAGNIEIRGQLLNELGNDYKKLAQDLKGTELTLEQEGSGKTQQFEAAVKRRIELLQQAREAGQLEDDKGNRTDFGADQAIAELQKIADNTKISVEARESARQAINKIRQDEIKDEKEQSDLEIAAIEQKVKRGIIAEEEGARQIADLRKAQGAKQLADIDAQIAEEERRIKAGSGSTERLEELKREREKYAQQSVQIEEDASEKIRQAKEAEFKEVQENAELEIAAIENKVKAGVLTEEQGAQQIIAIRKKLAQDRLKIVEDELKAEQAKGSEANQKRIQDLQQEQKKLNNEIAKADVDGREQVAAARKKDADLRKSELDADIALIEAAVSKGTKTRVDAEKEITKIRRQQLKIQLDLLQKSIAEEEAAIKAGRGSQTRLRQLQVEQKQLSAQKIKLEAESEKRLEDARKADQEKREKELEEKRQKALEKLKEQQIAAQIEVQKLVNSGALTEEQAGIKRIELQRQALQAELKFAKNSKERAEGTLKLLELEKQYREAVAQAAIAAIERENREFQRLSTAKKAIFESQIQDYTSINKLLEYALELNKAQIELQQTFAGGAKEYYGQAVSALEAQFKAEDEQEEKRKRAREMASKSPEEQAKYKKQQAREQQLNQLKIEAKQVEIEMQNRMFLMQQKSLEIEERKNEVLLAQAAIQAQIVEIEAKAGVLQSKADLKKIEANPNATEEEKAAGAAQVEAAEARLAGAQFSRELISQQQENQSSLAAVKREQLGQQAGQSLNRSKIELASLQGDTVTLRQLQQEALGSARTNVEKSRRGTTLDGVGQFDQMSSRVFDRANKQIEVTKTRPASEERVVQAIEKLERSLTKRMSASGLIISNTITNPDPSQTADMAAKRTIKALEDVFKKAATSKK